MAERWKSGVGQTCADAEYTTTVAGEDSIDVLFVGEKSTSLRIRGRFPGPTRGLCRKWFRSGDDATRGMVAGFRRVPGGPQPARGEHLPLLSRVSFRARRAVATASGKRPASAYDAARVSSTVGFFPPWSAVNSTSVFVLVQPQAVDLADYPQNRFFTKCFLWGSLAF